jgi:hypothetical protein
MMWKSSPSMVEATLLGVADLDLTDCPAGRIRYASMAFFMEEELLPEDVKALAKEMANGLQDLCVSYEYAFHGPRDGLATQRWHQDGKGRATEKHRLFVLGAAPTECIDGSLLETGCIWEYAGTFVHRCPVPLDGEWRLMLRVSQCAMPRRDRWLPRG